MCELDPAPLVLAFVFGNILETNFRQAAGYKCNNPCFPTGCVRTIVSPCQS
jgi:TctA family transporter